MSRSGTGMDAPSRGPAQSQSTYAARFTLSDVELDSPRHDERQALAGGAARSDRPPTAVFNLDMDYSDDDALLDWEAYSTARKVRWCGLDVTRAVAWVPGVGRPPPDWWLRASRRQRRLALTACCCATTFLVLLALLTAAAAAGRVEALAKLLRRTETRLCSWAEFRLPEEVRPTYQRVRLTLDMLPPAWAFQGVAHVDLTLAGEPSRCVVLHAAGGLQISGAFLAPDAQLAASGAHEIDPGAALQASSVSRVPDAELLVLKFPRPIAANGSAVLRLDFHGLISTSMAGLYRATLAAPGSNTSATIVSTQFESTHARKAFPCFDEPGFKPRWGLEVLAPPELVVLANMPAEAVHLHSSSLATWHFRTTPPMASYLVALVVGDLVGVSRRVQMPLLGAGGGDGSSSESQLPGQAREVNVTVWGLPLRRDQLDVAADAAAAALPYYEAALQTEYPLPKLDLVAVPDFSAGAMENWGLVTYRESALLVEPTRASRAHVSRVWTVVAHELAHLWFGDLVTARWWDELWLNEGFASWLETAGAGAAARAAEEAAGSRARSREDSLPPHQDPDSRDAWASFYRVHGPDAMALDALADSRPLSGASLASGTAIEAAFDAVSYLKGAAVLRMVRSWFAAGGADALPSGPIPKPRDAIAVEKLLPVDEDDPFFAALRAYLAERSLGSATAKDLWASLARQLRDARLPDKMSRWTYARGFPVLAVELDASRGVWLSQEPFRAAPRERRLAQAGDGRACAEGDAWWVPISYVTGAPGVGSDGQLRWTQLAACRGAAPAAQLGAGAWLKLNAQQLGFYRVQYPAELWRALAGAAGESAVDAASGLRRWSLNDTDLAGLLDDSYALAGAGRQSMAPFLELARALPRRAPDDAQAWLVALPLLREVGDRAPCGEAWAAWVRERLLRPFVDGTSAREQAQGTRDPLGGAKAADPAFAFAVPGAGPAVPKAHETAAYYLLRPALLAAAGAWGESSLLEQARLVLARLRSDDAAGVDADARAAALLSAVRGGAPGAYEAVRELYERAERPDEREEALRALCFDSGRARETLDWALGGAVKAQDLRAVVGGVAARGPEARAAAWDWLRESWDRAAEKLGGQGAMEQRILGQLAETVASGFVEQDRLEQLDALARRRPTLEGEAGFAARARESIRNNQAWVAAHGAAVCEWVGRES